MATWRIERVGPADWERLRAIRLRALADAPDAFGTALAEALSRPPEVWQARLAGTEGVSFLAVADADDVGLVMGAPYEGHVGAAGLFGMWVAPGHRGRGIAQALVGALVAWAREAGFRRVVLDVGDANASAIRLYEQSGFRRNGATGSLPPPRTHVLDHQRVLELLT